MDWGGERVCVIYGCKGVGVGGRGMCPLLHAAQKPSPLLDYYWMLNSGVFV